MTRSRTRWPPVLVLALALSGVAGSCRCRDADEDRRSTEALLRQRRQRQAELALRERQARAAAERAEIEAARAQAARSGDAGVAPARDGGADAATPTADASAVLPREPWTGLPDPATPLLAVTEVWNLLPGDDRATLAPLVNAQTAWALDAWARLRTGDENVAFSPLASHLALLQVAAGARGETEKELRRALHLAAPVAGLLAAAGALRTRLLATVGKDVQLEIGHRLLTQAGATVLPALGEPADRVLGSPVALVDLKGGGDSARRALERALDRPADAVLREAVRGLVVRTDARLLAASGLRLKAMPAAATTRGYESAFYAPGCRHQQAPMLDLAATSVLAGRFEDDGLEVVEVPLAGGTLSLVLLVPDLADRLALLEQRLNSTNLRRWLGGLSPERLRVRIPRLDLRASPALEAPLRALGAVAAWKAPPADLSGLAGAADRALDGVPHLAALDLGAAAVEPAPRRGYGWRHRPLPPRDDAGLVQVDRPFLYLLRHRQTGALLLLGRVAVPSATARLEENPSCRRFGTPSAGSRWPRWPRHPALGQRGGNEEFPPRLTVVGELDQEAVRTVFRREEGALRDCYLAGRKPGEQALPGHAEVRLTILLEGKASGVQTLSSTFQHPPTDQCLLRIIERLRFPRGAREPTVVSASIHLPSLAASQEREQRRWRHPR